MRDVTTADRLRRIMSERGLKQRDVLKACRPYCEKHGVRLERNDLSQYVSGKAVPRSDKLEVLAEALEVNEVWLMGYDVPRGRDALRILSAADPAKSFVCERYEECHDKEANEAVSLFLRLDTLDRGRIIGAMEETLKGVKYADKNRS